MLKGGLNRATFGSKNKIYAAKVLKTRSLAAFFLEKECNFFNYLSDRLIYLFECECTSLVTVLITLQIFLAFVKTP